MVFANVVCVSIFNAAEGLTDDVVTELVKTVEARAKRIKASEVRLDLHKDGHAEDDGSERWVQHPVCR
jgi:hypothetical protein